MYYVRDTLSVLCCRTTSTGVPAVPGSPYSMLHTTDPWWVCGVAVCVWVSHRDLRLHGEVLVLTALLWCTARTTLSMSLYTRSTLLDVEHASPSIGPMVLLLQHAVQVPRLVQIHVHHATASVSVYCPSAWCGYSIW